MCLLKRFSSSPLLFLFTVSFGYGQVLVPDRDNRSNPYSGNPTRGDTLIAPAPEGLQEEEEAREEVVNRRIFSDIFSTALPSIFDEGDWRLRLNPKLGDFFDEDYVRFPLGLEYNFSDYFETFFGVGTYFPNPFKNEGGWGTYNLELGAKYSWWNFADSEYNLSVGFKSDMPWTDPPVEIADGYARYEPFVAISREMNEDPATLVYLNVAYELIGESPFKATPISPRPRDRLFIRPGFIYYPGGNFRYSTEFEYRTNMLDHRSPDPAAYSDWIGTREYTRAFKETHEIFISPGITWFPTQEFRKGFFVPGNWDIGAKVDIPIIEKTGESLSVSLRFRWYYDYEDYLKTKLKDWWPLGHGE